MIVVLSPRAVQRLREIQAWIAYDNLTAAAQVIQRIRQTTEILRQGEGVMGITDLRVGQKVKVWFDGPVMESYPSQATAGVIVIEPSSR